MVVSAEGGARRLTINPGRRRRVQSAGAGRGTPQGVTPRVPVSSVTFSQGLLRFPRTVETPEVAPGWFWSEVNRTGGE